LRSLSQQVQLPRAVQLVKGWREILLLPRGVVIRRLYSDGTWQSELTKETFRVLYLPPESNESVAVLNGAFVQHSVLSASKSESDPTLRMMFAGRAAGTNASILFDSGALDNFVSSFFACKLVSLLSLPSVKLDWALMML
jgi:hypothetical protein